MIDLNSRLTHKLSRSVLITALVGGLFYASPAVALTCQSVNASHVGAAGSAASAVVDEHVQTGFETTYFNWNYVECDLGRVRDLSALRRFMTNSSGHLTGVRPLQGEMVHVSLDRSSWTMLTDPMTTGWSGPYTNYGASLHAWHSVSYGWSAWLQVNQPIATRYVRFWWDGYQPGEVLNEVAAVFANECGNGVVENMEQCDDGNLVRGDGCDEQCVMEVRARLGEAVYTRGNNQRLTKAITDPAHPLNPTEELTFSLWAKTPATPWETPANRWDGSGKVWNFSHDSTGVMAFTVNDGSGSRGNFRAFSGPMVAGQWTHYTMTFNRGTVRLYENGLPADGPITGTFPTSLTGGVSDFHLGHWVYNGAMGNVMFFDRALTASEVADAYCAVSLDPSQCACGTDNHPCSESDLLLMPGLVSYWPLVSGPQDVVSGYDLTEEGTGWVYNDRTPSPPVPDGGVDAGVLDSGVSPPPGPSVGPGPHTISCVSVTPSHTGASGSLPAGVVFDGDTSTGFDTSYSDWNSVECDLGSVRELGAVRRLMTHSNGAESGARMDQGEMVHVTLDGANWTMLTDPMTTGWSQAYVNYGAQLHAWHSLPYGWSGWLHVDQPIAARYIRYWWDDNAAVPSPRSEQLVEVEAFFANECGNGVVENMEQCDDGNLVRGDGCDEQCVMEVRARLGEAVYTRGNNQRLTKAITDPAHPLNPTEEFTFSLWAKTPATPWETPANRWDGSGKVWNFSHDSTGVMAFTVNDGSGSRGNFRAFSGPMVAGQWTHYTMTFNRGTVRLYENGLPADGPITGTFPTSLTGGVSDFHLGHWVYNGAMGNVMFFDRALTASEVADIYCTVSINPSQCSCGPDQHACSLSDVVLMPGLVSYWPLTGGPQDTVGGFDFTEEGTNWQYNDRTP